MKDSCSAYNFSPDITDSSDSTIEVFKLFCIASFTTPKSVGTSSLELTKNCNTLGKAIKITKTIKISNTFLLLLL